MNRARLRSRLLTCAFIVAVALAWWYFAPTSIGGSTRYVVTTGISMEPGIHRGDLAIVRPEDTYRVGQVVAYHSTMLDVTVLHRLIGRDGNRYIFKGDNNNFIDPTRPTRAELLGAMWLHVPRGGPVLTLIHSPLAAAILCGALGLLLVVGGREERRRRRKRARAAGGAGSREGPSVKTDLDRGQSLNWSAFLTASAVAGAVFALIGLFAFTRPADRPSVASSPYVQHVTFGYHARAGADTVYPTGAVHTGDPIFTQLVHRLDVHIDYRVTSAAQHAVRGNEEVVLQLTGPGGWSRTMLLAPRTRFQGDHTSTDVMLDLPHLESLFEQVTRQTGSVAGNVYTVAVQPRVHLSGTLAGESLKTVYTPSLSFQLNATQLVPGSAPSDSGSGAANPASGGAQAGLSQQQAASVGRPTMTANTVSFHGAGMSIGTLRRITLLGLLLSVGSGVFFYLRKRGEPFEESYRIQSQYGHMIVPIVGGEDLGWPPVDVPNIKALVRLAESGQRLILHNRADDVDTYMVNEEGTVYRYQVKASNVVWGDWSEAETPVKAAA